MKRIDTTTDNLFHDPDLETLEPGTIVPAESLNNFQEEIAHAVEVFEVLNPVDNHQLARGMRSMMDQARRWAYFMGRG